MRVIQAPEQYEKRDYEIACFMAGGMGDIEWQDIFLNTLERKNPRLLVVYNPYNPNIEFPRQQIKWEFDYLNNYINSHFIFSCYFDKYTDQPISMYELGRASVLHQSKTIKVETGLGGPSHVYTNYGFPVVVSIHPDAPKKEDIQIQCEYAGILAVVRTPEEHAQAVLKQYYNIQTQMGV